MERNKLMLSHGCYKILEELEGGKGFSSMDRDVFKGCGVRIWEKSL